MLGTRSALPASRGYALQFIGGLHAQWRGGILVFEHLPQKAFSLIEAPGVGRVDTGLEVPVGLLDHRQSNLHPGQVVHALGLLGLGQVVRVNVVEHFLGGQIAAVVEELDRPGEILGLAGKGHGDSQRPRRDSQQACGPCEYAGPEQRISSYLRGYRRPGLAHSLYTIDDSSAPPVPRRGSCRSRLAAPVFTDLSIIPHH